MPNAITADGLTTATRAELVAQLTAAFELIYGADIDLDPDSPDGQLMNIFIQSVLDLEDLITQVYNQFDPDNAIGNVLDQRVAINGIQRQAGTFTVTDITIATNQSVNLYGLDQDVQPVFTVADASGNKYQLQTTQTGFNPGSGGAALIFQAMNPGALTPTPNTITVPVTIILGVTTINNPTVATSIGINEETDAQLRVRRQQSVSLASQGYLAGLLAALENIPGMASVFVFENVTGSTDGDGVPGHSLWVIVSGTAAAADIAQAIYNKRNAGCGMFGAQSYTITQKDGSLFAVLWDNVTTQDLYIKFTATSLDGVNDPKISLIKDGLVTGFVPGVSDEVDINHLATAVQVIDPNCLVTSAGFSTSAGGSYTNTLSPTSKDKQFLVAAARVIILPMINYPKTSNVPATSGTVTFAAVGGYGMITYTLQVDNSGASLVGANYTAGATPNVTDTIRATDSLGNFADATVLVTP